MKRWNQVPRKALFPLGLLTGALAGMLITVGVLLPSMPSAPDAAAPSSAAESTPSIPGPSHMEESSQPLSSSSSISMPPASSALPVTPESQQRPESDDVSEQPASHQAESSSSPQETASAYTEWDRGQVYTGGQTVFFDGALYRARWWTQGETPSASGKWGVWERLASPESRPAPSSSPSVESEDSSASSSGAGESSAVWQVTAYAVPGQEGDPSRLPFDRFTHLACAFAVPTAESGLRELGIAEQARAMADAAHKNNRKAFLAVGGDTPADELAQSIATDAGLLALADAITSRCVEGGLDGVDIAWQFSKGDNGERYEALILRLRETLQAYGKLLTVCVSEGAENGALQSDAVLETVDWVNVSAGTGEANQTVPSENMAEYWLTVRGLTREKLALSMVLVGSASGG